MFRRSWIALGIFISAALSGCGDSPVAPPPGSSEALLGSADKVEVVSRTAALSSDEVVSKVVGPAGGIITLPRSGLTVVGPVGALAAPVNITVTAPSGSLVGYHFEPHGLVFRKPLIATQKTSGTDIGLLNSVLSPPFVAYFEGPLTSKVKALEVLNLNVLGLLGVVQFQIPHFSGYVIATD